MADACDLAWHLFLGRVIIGIMILQVKEEEKVSRQWTGYF